MTDGQSVKVMAGPCRPVVARVAPWRPCREMVDVALTDVAVGVVRRASAGRGCGWRGAPRRLARHGYTVCGRRAGRLSMRRDVVASVPSAFIEPAFLHLPSAADRAELGA